MKFIKQIFTVFIAIFLFVIFFTPQRQIFANSVCTEEPASCVIQYIPYTKTVENCVTDPYTLDRTCTYSQYTQMMPRCTIPQVGGGSCSCCWDDGCYLNCPNNNTGGGGGNNDDEPEVGGGSTPVLTTPGTITAVAREVTSDQTCTAVSNSTTGITGTEFSFAIGSQNQPAAQTQSGNTPVIFSSQPVGSYTLDYTLPSSEYTLTTPCIYRNGVLIAYGDNAYLPSGGTIAWRLGFTRGSAWAQTQGGDVYVSGALRSHIPNVTPRVFSVDNDQGYPGVVTYGTSYDFDNDWTLSGNSYASSKGWLTNSTRTTTDYYDFFYRRFGSPTITDNDSFINLAAVTQPDSRATPYYIEGDMITSGNWSVGTGESIVFIINGSLTIGGRINITGDGFVGFIVNGNIIVDSDVGTTVASTTSVVEGVYITSPTGVFNTGSFSAASTARFVGEGMFIAGDFNLERDLQDANNVANAAELFIYNPRLLITMPDLMKELPVVWQEVAP